MVCHLTVAGLEHGQHDLFPDSGASPGQCGVSRCVQRSCLLRGG